MNDFRIQQVNSAQWEKFRELRLKALRDSPDAFASTLEETRQRSNEHWIERLEDSSIGHFVAIADDQTFSGMAVGAPVKGVLATVGLYSMWVAPTHRRQRLGKSLISHVVQWARSQDYERLLLDVADDNTAAVALYDAMGFKATGNTSTLPPPREHVTEHERVLSLKTNSINAPESQPHE